MIWSGVRRRRGRIGGLGEIHGGAGEVRRAVRTRILPKPIHPKPDDLSPLCAAGLCRWTEMGNMK